jgi:branched-chain amino acid transport system permease protein
VSEHGPVGGGERRRPIVTPAAVVPLAMVTVAAVAPWFLDAFWLQVGLFAMAAAVAALGLGLLVGEAGQLSLAHSFFIMIGAYGYTYAAGQSQTVGVSTQDGLGLPPIVAVVFAVALAGLAGLAFSPIAARLRGVYLGVASLGLVFLGQHVLFNSPTVTGGFNGRDVPPFALFGFTFDDVAGETTNWLGTDFTRTGKLWFVALVALFLTWLFVRNVQRSRVGRALHAVRDGEIAASVVGIPVTRYKASAFMVSSMIAGLGGVVLALAFRRIVPETFGVILAIEYLAMVVIGGLGSAGGAIAGAFFVSALPAVLQRYSSDLPFLSASPTEGGITAGVAAHLLFGAAIVAVLLFEPGGFAGITRRVRHRLARLYARVRPQPTARPPLPETATRIAPTAVTEPSALTALEPEPVPTDATASSRTS